MVWEQKKFDGRIRAGESKLIHDCQECDIKREIPFKYFLRYQKIIHHGQCVEGDVEEWLRIETSLPSQIQCRDCGAVYNVQEPKPLMAKYSNPKKLSLYGETMACQNFGSMEKIDERLKREVKAISAELIGTPERV